MWKKTYSIEIWIPISLILLSSLVSFSAGCCEQKERISSLLETAKDLITKVQSENISCNEEHNVTGKVLDCADLYKKGYNESGVYTVWPITRLTTATPLRVYCDMNKDGGGWTVIQRRGDFGREDDYFFKDWESYKKGFGNIEKDFWLGNDKIFALTNQKLYSVRFDLEDRQGNKAFALYDKFWIDDEFNNYTLHISDYSGNAGDSMSRHSEITFGTKDRDNGLHSVNCGIKYKSGWWFKQGCFLANLNGIYNNDTDGIKWRSWKIDPLHQAEIKIRPFVF